MVAMAECHVAPITARQWNAVVLRMLEAQFSDAASSGTIQTPGWVAVIECVPTQTTPHLLGSACH